MFKDDKSALGDLYYEDSQEAVRIKDTATTRWQTLKLQKGAHVKQGGNVKWQRALKEFQGSIKSIANKCNATLGVLDRRKRRAKNAGDMDRRNLTSVTSFEHLLKGSDNEEASAEVRELTQSIEALTLVVINIGDLNQEVVAEIEAVSQIIDDERIASWKTSSGQTSE